MSDNENRAQPASKKTVLAASGAAAKQLAEEECRSPEGGAGQLGVADTFVAPGGLDAAGRPLTGAGAHATVLGASGAAVSKQGGGRLPITAPEISTQDPLAAMHTLPTVDPTALVGSVVADRYRILKMLGQGGMGVVYLAEHVVIEKRVALKVLNEELTHSRDAVSRFIYEAKAASKIGHENIVDINDFGSMPQGGVFFVMEFLDGADLSDQLRDAGRLPWEKCKSIGVQVCRALAAAHGKGIIHRDLKPENIFLIRQGGRDDFVKILDFGIAKFTGMEGGAPKQTKTGMIFGTPDYMAPEQAEAGKADHRVDIYSLGIILYQLVTGQLPFQAETFMGVLHQHMTKIPTPPRDLVPDLPASFDAVIRRSLEKNPDQRYQTMQELSAALEQVVEGSPASIRDGVERCETPIGSPAPDTAIVALPPDLANAAEPVPAASGRRLLVAAVLMGLAALAGGGILLFGGGRSKDAPRDTSPPQHPSRVVASRSASDAQPPLAARDARAPADRPSVPRPVKLRVVTRPEHAEVLLDGELVGHTPLEGYTLPYGERERVILVRKPGYRSQEIRFTPDGNQSWERTLERGRGLTRVTPERPPPMDVRLPPMDIRPPPMELHPPPMDGRPPPMGTDLKDPF